MKIAAACLLLACKSTDAVKCGPGTVLQNGVCIVAAPAKVAEAAPLPDAAISPLGSAAGSGTGSSSAIDAGWVYEEKTDQMRNATVRMARILSENTVDFGAPYGAAKMGIVLRKGDKASGVGTEAFLAIQPGQFECSYNGCAVSVKFDDGKVEKVWMNRANTSAGLFVSSAGKFIQRLKTTTTLMIEAEFYSEGRRQFRFNVAGLDFATSEQPVAGTAVAPASAVKPKIKLNEDGYPENPKTVREAMGLPDNEAAPEDE